MGLGRFPYEKRGVTFTNQRSRFQCTGTNAINVGSIKYLLKYSAEGSRFHEDSFLVNERRQISALQLAAALLIPRGHGMKIEVLHLFLIILREFALESWHLEFRSNGILPNPTALDIAASLGNVHAVRHLVKKGAHRSLESRVSALAWTNSKLSQTTDFLRRKNFDSCAFVKQNWDDDTHNVRRLADDWTNMRTIDEEHVNSSWEIVTNTRKSV